MMESQPVDPGGFFVSYGSFLHFLLALLLYYKGLYVDSIFLVQKAFLKQN